MRGIITIRSEFPVGETIDRLVAVVESKGLTVFSRIDHSANAAKNGLELRPTELLVFGNPKAGTILMQDQQIVGLDLPLKALAWQDANGVVWLSYNEISWVGDRHGLTSKSATTIVAIHEGMKAFAAAATTR